EITSVARLPRSTAKNSAMWSMSTPEPGVGVCASCLSPGTRSKIYSFTSPAPNATKIRDARLPHVAAPRTLLNVRVCDRVRGHGRRPLAGRPELCPPRRGAGRGQRHPLDRVLLQYAVFL